MKALSLLVIASASLSLALASNHSGSALEARTCGAPADAVPFYRTFNSAEIDHWYTPDATALNTYIPRGWGFESVLGLVFLTQEEGTAPLYHLYSLGATDNYYTMSATEVASAEQNGYSAVGNPPTLYIYPTQVCGSIPVYHLYSLAGTDNFYTTSEAERLQFLADDGYADFEITGYILPVGCS